MANHQCFPHKAFGRRPVPFSSHNAPASGAAGVRRRPTGRLSHSPPTAAHFTSSHERPCRKSRAACCCSSSPTTTSTAAFCLVSSLTEGASHGGWMAFGAGCGCQRASRRYGSTASCRTRNYGINRRRGAVSCLSCPCVWNPEADTGQCMGRPFGSGRMKMGGGRGTLVVTHCSAGSTPGGGAANMVASINAGHLDWGAGGGFGDVGNRRLGYGGDGGKDPAQAATGIVGEVQKTDPSDMWEHALLMDVKGMKCGGCVGSVKKILEGQDGVEEVMVNLTTETALVKLKLKPMDRIARGKAGEDGSEVDEREAAVQAAGERLAEALSDAGFDSAIRQQHALASSSSVWAEKRQQREDRLKKVTQDLCVAWGLASVCFSSHALHMWKAAPMWLHHVCSTPVHAALSLAALLGPGREIICDGWKALWSGRPDMNTLVGLGSVSSFGVSVVASMFPRLGWPTFFEEPAMLLGFVLVGRALEERAKLQAGADMVALQQLVPAKARLVVGPNGKAVEVPVEMVEVGDMLEVKPGERVPVDGVVVAGRSTVDESALTGEALPITKQPGDTVTAGTLNCDGEMQVESHKAGQHTMIADVVRMVEMAQARTAPIQRLADEVSGKFAAGIMATSAATFAFWSSIGTKLFPQVLAGSTATAASGVLLSLQLACSVLVVACPCALGLATPTAVLVGTAAAARHGLLVRGGDVLEEMSRVDTVVFDKTGTLTAGRPHVERVHCLAELKEEELLRLAAAAEQRASHPIARALASAAPAADLQDGSQPSTDLDPGTFHQQPGSGVRGQIDGHLLLVGNLDWLSQHGISACDPSVSSVAVGPLPAGTTRVFIGWDNRLVGAIDVADRLRHDAVDTIKELQKQGINTIMLSGDRRESALAIAAQVGIAPDQVVAEVKPAEKAAIVESLKKKGAHVAMVGDGVNDTVALATANVGVAMGAGVDAASDVASMVLTRDEVYQVAEAIQLSKMTVDKIKQNLFWAFGYNLLAVPMAAGLFLPWTNMALTPSISAAFMGMSSVLVTGNSLLLQLEVNNKLSKAMIRQSPPGSEVEA